MDKTKQLSPRDEKGHFLKGHSGNPSGRVARPIALADGRLVSRTELFQMHLGDAVQCLADVLHSEKSKDRDRIVAAKILIEHAVGTPKQHVEVNSTSDRQNANVIAVTLDQTDVSTLKALLNAEVIDVEPEMLEPDDE